ncbi:hypothetical protein BAUCODRAFT_51294, partial [Baudoinia panamericana UAMH 10762]
SSPLSPGYGNLHMDSLQPPSPRSMHARAASNNTRRARDNSLKLPSLPRFHPANFPSAQSSLQNTPSERPSPMGPMSPRTHQRMLSDAQKQLYNYQRESVTAAHRNASPNRTDKPDSPRLEPLGSPGPVTPLELEGEDGYLMAGVRSASEEGPSSEEVVEKLIREEARRRRD